MIIFDIFIFRPYMGKDPRHLKPKEEHIDVLDFIDSNENSNLLDEMPSIPLLSEQDISSVIPSFSTTNVEDFWSEKLFELDKKEDLLQSDESEVSKYEPRIIQVTNFQDATEMREKVKMEVFSDDEASDEKDVEDEPYEVKYACEKSLFKPNTTSTEKYPWEVDLAADQIQSDDFAGDRSIELIGEYEENEIFKRLKVIFEASKSQKIDIPPWVRRHYRKLCVRKMQRSFGKPIFNLDKFKNRDHVANTKQTPNTTVLDRFHHLISASGNFTTGSKSGHDTFIARLAGSCQHDLFISPHTGRILHPFIYQNDTCVPPWVKLMCELQYEVNGQIPTRASIDFCYVRPQHIAAVNALLQRMFWPGIDSK